MHSTKTITLTAAVLVAAAMLANASPAQGLGDTRQATIHLPAGHVLQGQEVGGAWVLSAVTPDAAASALNIVMPSAADGMKECDNDVPGDFWYTWYSVSTVRLTGEENLASRGGCVEQTHMGPVALMQFRTAGDYYGSVYAEGCVDVPSVCGWYVVACSPAGAALGLPGASGWSTLVSGRDMSCFLSSQGSQPNEWDHWVAYVGNAHTAGGYAYARFM